MKQVTVFASVLCLLMAFSTAQAQVVLRVDFNSNQDGGGDSTTAGDPGLSVANHNQTGWSSYHANHEVAAEFSTANYGGITVAPAWPNTTDNRVMQSIDRTAGYDDNWNNAAGDLDLVTDFIGIDTRTGNGGNGDWNGTSGTPTHMTLAIGGLAGGTYNWTSFHQDTENLFCDFAVWISTDGGTSFTQLADGLMTDSTPGGDPDSDVVVGYNREVGPDVFTLPSTYTTTFTANGADDVVFRFAPYSGAIASAVHNQIWGMNGFVLEVGGPPTASNPDPTVGETSVAIDLSDPERVVAGHLSWQAPDHPEITSIQGYDLYLDPNENKVIARAGDCLIAQTNLPAPQYDPPSDFDFSTTYHWVVDSDYTLGNEPNEGNLLTPWHFTSAGAGPEVDAGDDIITALELLPANLAGTVVDPTMDVASVEWEIIAYPGVDVQTPQMIDRGGNDGSPDPNFLRDWIGTDMRTPRVGDPLVLTISGLPADTYTWTSTHHDTHDQTGMFDVTVIDFTGSNTTTDVDISKGDQGGTAQEDPNTFMATIVSDGSDVQVIFDHHDTSVNSLGIFVMNGFVLTGTGDPLKIDFGQPDTPVKAGYQAYQAQHEVIATYVPQTYSAFGGADNITVDADWGPAALGLINASVTKTNADSYFPTADLTTDTEGSYIVRLTATDSEDQVDSDTVQVTVAADACAAAQLDSASWNGFNYYDRDEDCDVDLLDFAPFAAEWLEDRSLTGQVTN